MRPIPLKFAIDDAHRAYDDWGANCGPGAIAAMAGMTLDELRPYMGDFEKKHYTNPKLMFKVLDNLEVSWKLISMPRTWPDYGLARVQWMGPWTEPGVSIWKRYRHTHWVGSMFDEARNEYGIFDINCMNSGGWVSLFDWADSVVPWIVEELEPEANGRWQLTHVIEIDRDQLV